MVSFLELVKNRYSVRAYKDTPVEKDKLTKCIEAAHLAPSACNAQPWKFIIVDDPYLKNQIADATADKLLPMNHFTKQAPILVVVVMEKPNLTSAIGSVLKNKPYTLIDIGIATIQFCLQATDLGLGTCIIGWFNEKKIKSLLKIPSSKRPVLVITLGYPENSETPEKKRKSIDEILSYNLYA